MKTLVKISLFALALGFFASCSEATETATDAAATTEAAATEAAATVDAAAATATAAVDSAAATATAVVDSAAAAVAPATK